MKNINRLFKIILIILFLSVCLFLGVCLCSVYMNGEQINVWAPEDGLWYCEDLQIQMSFDPDVESYAIVSGEHVHCVTGNNRGSLYIGVYCQETGIPGYQLGDAIFFGKVVELTGNKLTLEDCNTGQTYVFLRVIDSELME